VLHVGKYYPPVPGGMERVLQLLCEHERAAVDSRVLVASTGRKTTADVQNGVPVTFEVSETILEVTLSQPVLPHSSAVFVFDAEGRARLLIQPELGAADIAADLARLVGGA